MSNESNAHCLCWPAARLRRQCPLVRGSMSHKRNQLSESVLSLPRPPDLIQHRTIHSQSRCYPLAVYRNIRHRGRASLLPVHQQQWLIYTSRNYSLVPLHGRPTPHNHLINHPPSVSTTCCRLSQSKCVTHVAQLSAAHTLYCTSVWFSTGGVGT